MKKIGKRILTLLLMFAMVMGVALCVLPSRPVVAEAKNTIRISSKSEVLWVGEKVKLKVKGTKKKVKWYSKNKRIATVNKRGVVTGKSEGETTIVAKVAKKTLKCAIDVYDDDYDDEDDYDDVDYDSDDSSEESSVTESQAKNVRFLADYIKKNGYYDSDDRTYNITYSLDDYGAMITYDPVACTIEFTLVSLDEYADTRTFLTMTTTADIDLIKKGEATFVVLYDDYQAYFTAGAVVTAASYNVNTNLDFHVTDTNYPSIFTDYEIDDVSNSVFSLAMLAWTITLQEEVDSNMSMQDLGFVNYDWDDDRI